MERLLGALLYALIIWAFVVGLISQGVVAMIKKSYVWIPTIVGGLILFIFVWFELGPFHSPITTGNPVAQQEVETCHFRQDAKTIYGYSLDMEVCQVGDNVLYERYYWKGKKVIEFKYTLKNNVMTVSIWEDRKLIEMMTKNPVKTT